MNNQDSFDATQRVELDPGEQPPKPPKTARRPRPTPAARAAWKKRQSQIIMISLIAVAVILVVAIALVGIKLINETTEDDGLILKGVNAAGVDLGGMTPEQAKQALHEYTDGTYSQISMVVSVLDYTVTLSPEDTDARLDVDAVVEAAYNYGRTGSKLEQQLALNQAQSSGYTVSILPYLNLDTDYIQSVVNDLGVRYSTTLKESSYRLEGTRPSMEQEEYDLEQVYQTLVIQLGTAEYGLNTDALLEQILDAYDINLFEVTAQCTITTPAALDYDQIMIDAGCMAPVNAQLNVDTYEVTPEVYGYGFTMEELRSAVENAAYGETVTVELRFLKPSITKDYYTEGMFQDTLSSFATKLSDDSGWNANLELVCQLLNGTIVETGAEFSFNSVIGEPTAKRGFQYAEVFLGKSYQRLMGGGSCQAASTLYYCALAADLEILERHSHSYATEFIQPGFDAEIYYGGDLDLRFRNNTENPLRIDAVIENGQLKITLIGIDTKTYTVSLNYQIDQTLEPGTVTNTMSETNPGGYQAGDVLTEGITGYSISTYITRTDKADPSIKEEVLIAESYYAKRDQVIVDIYIEPTEPPTTVPPTTEAPTTTPPTTEAPTTVPPTTVPPTTEAPTTTPPTTEAPTTVPPTTVPPTTEAPTTVPPTTEAPTTTPPTTVPPTTVPPTTTPPTTTPPTTTPPATEAPTVETTAPTDPTEPMEPTNPTEPTAPTEPSIPPETAAPSAPAETTASPTGSSQADPT